MGWGNCGTDSKGRPIGYAFEAQCDHPGCNEKIDRGLDYACGGTHGQGEFGCQGYFCMNHLHHVVYPEHSIDSGKSVQVCSQCFKLLIVNDDNVIIGYIDGDTKYLYGELQTV